MKLPHFFTQNGFADWGIHQDSKGYFVVLGSRRFIQAEGSRRFRTYNDVKTHLRNCGLINTTCESLHHG